MSKKAVVGDAVRQSSTYGIASIARRGMSFLLSPVYTRYLSQAQYGVLGLLDTTVNFAGGLFGMRMGETLIYLYSQETTDDGRERAVVSSFLISVLTGLILMVPCWMAAPKLAELVLGSAEMAEYVRLALAALLFLLPIETGLAYIRLRNQPGLYSSLSVVRLAVAAGLNVVLLVGFGMGVKAFLYANLAASCGVAIFLAYYCLAGKRFRFDPRVLVQQFRYGGPLAVHGLAMLVIHDGDRFFLLRAVSTAQIGVYAFAYKISMLISYVHTPFDTYWRAHVFQLAKRDDADAIYVRLCTYLMLTLVTIGVFIVVFLDPILLIMSGPDFRIARTYIPLLVVAYLARALGDQFRTVLRLQAQTHKEAWITLCSTAFCVFCYAILIPRFQVWGAVWATLLTFLVMLGLSYFISQKVKHYPFELGRLWKLAGCGMLAGVASQLLHSSSVLWNALTGCLLMLGYLAGLWITGFAEEEEIDALREGFLRLRQRWFPARKTAPLDDETFL